MSGDPGSRTPYGFRTEPGDEGAHHARKEEGARRLDILRVAPRGAVYTRETNRPHRAKAIETRLLGGTLRRSTLPRPAETKTIRIMGKMEERDRLAERLAELLDPRSEILEAYLFGSYARGEEQPHSDIDVAVRVDETRTDNSGFGYRARITTDLMAGLGFNDVDVLILNRAPPVLYHRVLRDGVRVLSRDLAATTTREGQALSRYCDFVPQLAKMEAARRWAAKHSRP